METKYGIISDVHRDSRIVAPAVQVLKSLGAQKLILNGDIGNSQSFVACVIDSVGKTGLETFVQPGSHEKLEDFEPVIEYFSSRHPNLVNVFNQRKAECEDHHLVFMPGTDWCCGGQYLLRDDNLASGFYETDNEKIRLTDMRDLRRLITVPEKTIVVCHVPRKFEGLETCIDVAEFGEVQEDFRMNGELVERGAVYPIHVARQVVQLGAPVELKKENRGNGRLKEIYEELGIRKAVSGHFHESGHRANDRNSQHVKPGEFVDELFWNSGYLDMGQTGILTVKDGKVSYQNVMLQDYLK